MTYVLQHICFAAFTIGLGIYFFTAAGSMPASASLFPRLVAVLVLILTGAMVFQSFRNARTASNRSDGAIAPVHVTRVVVYVVLTVGYIWSIPRFGYFVATPLFMLLSYAWLRALGPMRAILVSVGFSVFIYSLFVWFLKLPIPMGVLESLLG